MKESSEPFFSIIIPTYNVALYIDTCLESILNQTYTDFEVIIVDDSSTDSTVNTIQKYSDRRIYLIRHDRNVGPGAARNTAIKNSSGKWLVCVDGDDWIANTRLQELYDYIQKNEVDIIADNNYILKSENSVPKETLFSKLGIRLFNTDVPLSYQLTYTPAIHPCIRKEFLQKNNLQFLEETAGCEDYGLWIRSILVGGRMHFIQKPLYFYRETKTSLTKSKERIFNSLIANTTTALSLTTDTKHKQLLEKKLHEVQYKQKIYQAWQDVIIRKNIISVLTLIRYLPFIFIFTVKKIRRKYV